MQTDSDNKFSLGPIRLSPVMLGIWVALFTFTADQLSKVAFIGSVGHELFTPPPAFVSGPSIEVLPFFNLTLVWNTGMSYGLFQSDASWGWVIYTVFTLAVLPFLLWWLNRTRSLHVAVAVGFVIGGAVGNNLVDRIFYHAVVDFLHFHVGDFHWYVFNVADMAIVFGVLLLIYDAFWGTEQQSSQ